MLQAITIKLSTHITHNLEKSGKTLFVPLETGLRRKIHKNNKKMTNISVKSIVNRVTEINGDTPDAIQM